MKTKGLHTHRFRDNPEEQRFAEAWAKQDGSGKQLDYQLDVRRVQGGCPPPVDERDRVVAATVIQWLGSPVGQAFLRDLGYERSGAGDIEILWAALAAMVEDIHAPQDRLTKAQWDRAGMLFQRYDRLMNERKT